MQATASQPQVASSRLRRSFTPRRLLAAALLIAAFALRLAEVQNTNYKPVGDGGIYLSLASQVSHTGDYSTSHKGGVGAGGTLGPSTYFAPGYPYYLGAVDLITGHRTKRGAAIQSARIAQVPLGTLAVALIGLVALEAFGSTVALIALALAAFYPVLIELDRVIAVENLEIVPELAAVWAALRVPRSLRPYAWVAAAGVFTGLATLTHENEILILLPLLFAVWRGRPRFRPRSLAAPALLIAVTALTILPWTIRNAVLLDRFIPVSDEGGITLAGTYNAQSAAYAPVPYKWRVFYGIKADHSLISKTGQMTEPELGDKLQSQAFHYIEQHPTAPLQVLYHNTLRMFELEGTFAWHASAHAVGLDWTTAGIGVICFWVLCGLALAGAFTRLARSAPRWLWFVPLLLALSVVLVNVETPRFREPVDPYLILLAACALATASARLAQVLRRSPVARVRGDAAGLTG